MEKTHYTNSVAQVRFVHLHLIQNFKDVHPKEFQNLWNNLKHIIAHTTEEFIEFGNEEVCKLNKLFNWRKKTINHKTINNYLSKIFYSIQEKKDQYDMDVINYIYVISEYIDLEKNYLGDDNEFIDYLPNLLYHPVIDLSEDVIKMVASSIKRIFLLLTISWDHMGKTISSCLSLFNISISTKLCCKYRTNRKS